MNERIRQLTEQCYEHDQSWTGVGQRIFNKEKFAELIVAECADIAKHHVMTWIVLKNILELNHD